MLLKTKFYPPPDHASLIARPGLAEILESGLRKKLSLIAAPAGFGKTTVVSSWLRGRNQSFAWLSLDERDNDVIRIWTYCLAALRSSYDLLQESLDVSEDPLGIRDPYVLIHTLIESVMGIGEKEETLPFILVLDDYHVVSDKKVHESFNYLLDHQPAGLHLVVIARQDPPFKIARRLARQEVAQLRSTALRFSHEEASTFLTERMAIELADEDVSMLMKRTEGWIASLHLAALTLQHHASPHQFIAEFAGDDRYIVDYLLEEVFALQSPDIQYFLMITSILDRFCAPLCDELLKEDTEHGDAFRRLEEIERKNLFLTPLDNHRGWFRYHQLFADVLRMRLKQRYPEKISTLHEAASRWYEKETLVAEAIHHAIEAKTWGRTMQLVEVVSRPMARAGELRSLRDILTSIPTEVLYGNVYLTLDYVRVLVLTGDLSAAGQHLDAVEPLLKQESEETALGLAASLRAHISMMLQHYEETIIQAQNALRYLPSTLLLPRSYAASNLLAATVLVGRIREAEALSQMAYEACVNADNKLSTGVATAFSGWTQFQRGRLYAAERILERVKPLLSVELLNRCHTMHLLEGYIAYERNLLDEARKAFDFVVRMARITGRIVFVGSAAHVGLARIEWRRHNHDKAWEHIEQSIRLAESLRGQLSLMEVEAAIGHFRLEEDNIDYARRLCERLEIRMEETIDTAREDLYRLLARIHLAEKRFDLALEVVNHLIDFTEENGLEYHRLQMLCLKSVICFERGDVTEALRAIEPTLLEAKKEGFVRMFLDEGNSMARVLYHATAKKVQPDIAGQLLKIFNTGTLDTAEKSSPRVSSNVEPLIDPLSERELDVLRLLADDLSNQAIAEHLFVSLNTVKTHTKNIYSKLGISGRREAVRQAKTLGLI